MLKHCKGTQKDSGMHIWPSAFDCWHMFQNIFLRMLRNQEHAPVLKEPFLRSSTMRNLPKLLDLLIFCKYSLNFSSFRLKFPASDLFDKNCCQMCDNFLWYFLWTTFKCFRWIKPDFGNLQRNQIQILSKLLKQDLKRYISLEKITNNVKNSYLYII